MTLSIQIIRSDLAKSQITGWTSGQLVGQQRNLYNILLYYYSVLIGLFYSFPIFLLLFSSTISFLYTFFLFFLPLSSNHSYHLRLFLLSFYFFLSFFTFPSLFSSYYASHSSSYIFCQWILPIPSFISLV